MPEITRGLINSSVILKVHPKFNGENTMGIPYKLIAKHEKAAISLYSRALCTAPTCKQLASYYFSCANYHTQELRNYNELNNIHNIWALNECAWHSLERYGDIRDVRDELSVSGLMIAAQRAITNPSSADVPDHILYKMVNTAAMRDGNSFDSEALKIVLERAGEVVDPADILIIEQLNKLSN